jgi:hypothetical protein
MERIDALISALDSARNPSHVREQISFLAEELRELELQDLEELERADRASRPVPLEDVPNLLATARELLR